MARNVNIFFSNFRLGTFVTFQRRLIDVTVEWTADDGTPRTDTRTVTFPDILALVPSEDRDDLLRDIILMAHRRNVGIESVRGRPTLAHRIEAVEELALSVVEGRGAVWLSWLKAQAEKLRR